MLEFCTFTCWHSLHITIYRPHKLVYLITYLLIFTEIDGPQSCKKLLYDPVCILNTNEFLTLQTTKYIPFLPMFILVMCLLFGSSLSNMFNLNCILLVQIILKEIVGDRVHVKTRRFTNKFFFIDCIIDNRVFITYYKLRW